jgi:hypothetical protein
LEMKKKVKRRQESRVCFIKMTLKLIYSVFEMD